MEIRVFDLPKVIKERSIGGENTLVFRQRQDIDKERKSERGFSREDRGANSRIIELRTTGPYTHTGGC